MPDKAMLELFAPIAIKLVLHRDEDMRMTGKLHPYSSDFKMGLTHDGQILAYEVTFYQNAGAVAELSSAVLGSSLFRSHSGLSAWYLSD
ncbi:MAG: hypothetical protein DRR19_07800 [Candidatus Parabeggiatoa sp. nov. 1]|nr:MAG: hypothetical protein DRR19_07800 [Gammaproteobacteria bacterium]